MDIKMIGKQIAKLRKDKGYTQNRLSEILNVSPQAVSKWENGRAFPEITLLQALSRALGTSIDNLLLVSRLQIISAVYGDGMQFEDVTLLLNRLVENDELRIKVDFSLFSAYQFDNNRPKYLTLKYRNDSGTYCNFALEGSVVSINQDSESFKETDSLEIVAASYGSGKTIYDVMHKIEHYKVFNWNEYHANHETFPSDPTNDDKDYLTFVYINQDSIHLVTCEEGESIAMNKEKTAFYRKQMTRDHFIEGVPMIPEFGRGWECSWAAALTAALQAMNIKTSYEHVMGVSGACYRLAFCSPGWDYSSVDGLVAYDYATPGYKAFGFTPKFADRVEKENRSEERKYMLNQIRQNMPVLGINLRVAAEWGVICGYKDSGADLFCRTKYDDEIINSQDFEKGKLNPYDYLFIDNWPFIITYFDNQTIPPSGKENLINSLKVFVDCVNKKSDRYAMGYQAYEVWQADLMNDSWYENNDNEQFARRFSVNQFCSLALADARGAAHVYLRDSSEFISEKDIIGLFEKISEKALQIHKMLDSGEMLEGARARAFWTRDMRYAQAGLLGEMCELERQAEVLARKMI